MGQEAFVPSKPPAHECIYCLNRDNLRETFHGDLICVDLQACLNRRRRPPRSRRANAAS